ARSDLAASLTPPSIKPAADMPAKPKISSKAKEAESKSESISVIPSIAGCASFLRPLRALQTPKPPTYSPHLALSYPIIHTLT
ncbi:hypothetical protein CH063_08468, partial [Colletotrichum higginsianum]